MFKPDISKSMEGVYPFTGRNLASVFVDLQQQITYNLEEISTFHSCSVNGGRQVEGTQDIWPRNLTLVLELTTTLEEMESDLLSCYQ